MTVWQSGMGGRSESANFQNDFYSLVQGRVASPVSPLGDPVKFDEYVDYCLKTWTVDVVLDDGRYLAGCRIVVPQGNEREGIRRMFKFPRDDFKESAWLGDKVVVGFIGGNINSPVVLGCLYPIPLGTSIEEDLVSTANSGHFLTPDHNEWRERHDFVDYDNPDNPLPAHTETRDSALNTTRVHETLNSTTGEAKDNTRNFVSYTDTNADTLEYEHSVESGDLSNRTTNSVFKSDTSARDLYQTHSVKDGQLTSTVTFQDLAASLIQLFQSVETAPGEHSTLGAKSDGDTVVVSHETSHHLFTLIVDALAKNFSLTKVDKDNNSNASIGLHANSKVVIRRASDGGEDSWVVLDSDGTVTAQSSFGSAIRLSNGRVYIKSGQSSVTLDNVNGIVAVSGDGAMLSLKNGSTVVSGTALTVQAESVALTSGAIRIGPSGTGNSIPSTQQLYSKLEKLESRLKQFEVWASTHRHEPNKPPPLVPPSIGKDDSFTPDKVKNDSLQSVTGD